jgi:hypothetical protein
MPDARMGLAHSLRVSFLSRDVDALEPAAHGGGADTLACRLLPLFAAVVESQVIPLGKMLLKEVFAFSEAAGPSG